MEIKLCVGSGYIWHFSCTYDNINWLRCYFSKIGGSRIGSFDIWPSFEYVFSPARIHVFFQGDEKWKHDLVPDNFQKEKTYIACISVACRRSRWSWNGEPLLSVREYGRVSGAGNKEEARLYAFSSKKTVVSWSEFHFKHVDALQHAPLCSLPKKHIRDSLCYLCFHQRFQSARLSKKTYVALL
jgi:hypothetical protein